MINPKNGKPAVLQTRQEHYDLMVAAGAGNLPELVRSGDIVVVQGNRVLVKEEDVTTTDVRVICPETGECSGWAKDSEAAIAVWNAANS